MLTEGIKDLTLLQKSLLAAQQSASKMRTLGLCVVALAATICSGYIPGREYHYHTEGKILQELDKKVHQHAGFMFKGDLVLQANEHGSIIKLVDPKFRLVNERPPDHEEDRIYLSSPFAEHLTKPFELICENGIVKEIKVAKDDNIWSVNLKKAIAAKFVLQTDYEKAQLLQPSDYKDDELKLDRKNYYMTSEDGIHGECQVDYDVDDSHENVVKVTKIKNFDFCERATYRYYINHDKYIPLQSEGEVKAPVHRSEVSHYKLQGNRQKYVVEKMNSEERVVFAPYGHDADFIKGDATVLMELKSSEELKEAFRMPDDAVTHHDLHFQFQEPVEIKDAEDLKKEPHGFFHYIENKIPVEKVAEHFNHVVNIRASEDEPYTKIFKDKTMSILFMQLASAMASFNYDELQQFYKHHVVEEAKEDSKELHQRRDLFVDAIVYAGTSSSFMFVKHLIVDKQVSTFAIPHVLQQLPLTLKEFSPVLIEEFYTLCTDPYVHDTPNTRKICLLAFSKFVHDQCLAKYENVYARFNTTEKILCTPETAEKYFQKILASYEDHLQDSFEFSTFIKVAGNLATRGSMRYIVEKIVHDDSLPTYYRFSAMQAIVTCAEYYYDELLPLIAPIYFDTSEVHEIRIVALFLITSSEVKLHLVESIADNLEHEPDHQVAHYTMTTLQQMAESGKHPAFTTNSEMGKKVLRYLKRVDFKIKFDLRHSFTKTSEKYNEKWRIGGGNEFTYITSNRGYIPRHIDIIGHNFIDNVMEVPFSIDYVGYGLEKYVDQIISLKKQKISIFDVLRRKARDVNIVEKELKEINDKLHIDKRSYEPLYADISIYAYGSLVNFFHFNESTVQTFAQQGAAVLPTVLNALKDIGKFSTKRFFSGKQFKFVAPSMLGVPLYIDVSEACFFYYRNNNIKLNIEPDIFGKDVKDDTPVSINLKFDGQPVQELVRIVTGGALYPSIDIATGAGIIKRDYTSSPMNLKISWEPNTPKLVLKSSPVAQVRIHKSFFPFTMVYNMSTIHSDWKDGSFLPYARKNELQEVDVTSNLLEVRLNGSVGKLHVLESVGSVMKFLDEHSLYELMSYLHHNPLATPYDFELTDLQSEDDIYVTMDTFGYDTPPDKMYKPDFPTVRDGHEEHLNSRGDKRACTCVLKAERVSKGAVNRKVIAEVSYTNTFNNLYHMINVFYDSSPVTPSDHDHFKVCYSSSIRFPAVDTKKLYELDTVNMDPKIKVFTDIHFGKNCENDQTIKIRGEMSRTEEHKQLQADRENHEVQCPRTNKDAYLYKKCKEDVAKGIHYSLNCRKYWSRSLKLRHYTFDIEHENLDSDAKSFFSQLETLLKSELYYYLDEHHSEVELDGNKIHVEANFSAKTDHVDIKVTKPHKILEFNHVPHPRPIQGRIANPFFEFTNKMTYWSRYKFPFCSIEGDHVHTFDYAKYELPPIDCYKVLAKDCSEKGLFTILGKKITHNRFNKAVKVFIPHLKIEALPVSAESDILVRINGHHIPVTQAEPHYHFETIRGKNVLMFSVSFNGLLYKIKSDHYGVTVYYDGKAIIINLSPYYVGKQCGLCGEYNNNQRDKEEFLGPTKCVHHNTTSFSYSYAIPQEDCSHIPDVASCHS